MKRDIVLKHRFRSGDGRDVVLPAGTYYVGDGCYVLDDESIWMPLVEVAFPGTDQDGFNIVVEIDGFTMFKWSTVYGDGTYSARINNACYDLDVDSGSLAFVDLRLCKVSESYIASHKLGAVVTFDEPVTLTIHENSDVSGPNVYVEIEAAESDTDDWQDDEEDEDEEE